MKPGAVRLNVADLDRAQAFYESTVGLRASEGDNGLRRLGADGPALVELVASPDAPRRPPGTTGLFHLAILLPSRVELARALRRVGRSGWPLSGASDHLVSEALYLSDPEGNGIEIYRDRPRSEWRYEDGQLQMSTLPLDLDGLAAEPGGEELEGDGMPPEARIGHVHLNVADLDAHGGLLPGPARVRGHRSRLSGRPVPLNGRLPPRSGAQYLGRRGRPAAPGGGVGPEPIRAHSRRSRRARRCRAPALQRGGRRKPRHRRRLRGRSGGEPHPGQGSLTLSGVPRHGQSALYFVQ